MKSLPIMPESCSMPIVPKTMLAYIIGTERLILILNLREVDIDSIRKH